MFEGSANVPEGKYDQWLEAAGGENNGSTTTDRTNYWINVPSNALELALFLESDRMAYLLNTMSKERVDGQRDVVKNERRQSYENRPYGMAFMVLSENLYPPDHPYHWPTIGSMADLSAASYEDVVEFFKTYYAPNNASLCIGGDIDPVKARTLVEKWFAEVPAGKPVPPVAPPSAFLGEEKRLMFEDKVSLPRLYMAWQSPRAFAPGDAELDVLANVLAGGKNSRLYKRLVYDMQIAQDVSAYQASSMLGSMYLISATARSGHTLGEIEKVIQEEVERIKLVPPSQREVDRAVNQYESGFLDRLESIGGFGGKADQLNWYYVQTGNPDYFNEDLARYRAVDPQDISTAAMTTLPWIFACMAERVYCGRTLEITVGSVRPGSLDSCTRAGGSLRGSVCLRPSRRISFRPFFPRMVPLIPVLAYPSAPWIRPKASIGDRPRRSSVIELDGSASGKVTSAPISSERRFRTSRRGTRSSFHCIPAKGSFSLSTNCRSAGTGGGTAVEVTTRVAPLRLQRQPTMSQTASSAVRARTFESRSVTSSCETFGSSSILHPMLSASWPST